MKTKKPSEVQNIIKKNSNNLAFLVGNGINIHFGNKTDSWNDLLLDLWQRYSFSTKTSIPEGISFTEFYDVLTISNYHEKSFSSELQKRVVEVMSGWTSDNRQNELINRIKALDAPVLTTNFDSLIPDTMNLNFYKITEEGFTDWYPWSCYYSEKSLSDPLEGFGVWYINGMIKYHKSIKLGLSEYMRNVTRATSIISGKAGTKELLNHAGWEGSSTWLSIFFNRSLMIFGLSLDENEIFLRWLLIQRAKYFRMHPSEKKQGWYLHQLEIDGDLSEGKKFFLESIGFEVLPLQKYADIYEEIWK